MTKQIDALKNELSEKDNSNILLSQEVEKLKGINESLLNQVDENKTTINELNQQNVDNERKILSNYKESFETKQTNLYEIQQNEKILNGENFFAGLD